jgi:hypothetical protein
MGFGNAIKYQANRMATRFAPGNYDASTNPYLSGQKKIEPGQRQTDWKEIMKHGEHSDTNWGDVFKTNLNASRQAYSYVKPGMMGSKNKLALKKMSETDRRLWESTRWGTRGTNPSRPDQGYLKYKQFMKKGAKARYMKPTSAQRREGQRDGVYRLRISKTGETMEYSKRRYEKYVAHDKALEKASWLKRSNQAQWMAEYNKKLNKMENEALNPPKPKPNPKNEAIRKKNEEIKKKNEEIKKKNAETKVRNENKERFKQMQITRELGNAQTKRSTQKRGIQGLMVRLSASGLGIPR